MIIDDAQLPIVRVTAKGPAVDAHNNRKECDDAQPMTAEILRRNYERVRAPLLAGLTTLADHWGMLGRRG